MSVEMMKIALVISQFNETVTHMLYNSARRRLHDRQIMLADDDVQWVPGAVEIPLIAQQYARSLAYDAIICLGAVIRGETNHYNYVCDLVSRGCQSVSLAHNIPVVFGILTTESKQQAIARANGEHSDKGREAVDTAFSMIKSMRKLANEVIIRE